MSLEMRLEQSQPQRDWQRPEDKGRVLIPSLLGAEKTGFQPVAWGPADPPLSLSRCVTQCLACPECSDSGKSCFCCFHGSSFYPQDVFWSAVARYGKQEDSLLSGWKRILL